MRKADLLLRCLTCSSNRCRLSLWQVHVQLNATTTHTAVSNAAAATDSHALSRTAYILAMLLSIELFPPL